MTHHLTANIAWVGCALALMGCEREVPGAVTLDVFAASSLTEAFVELERGFERAHGGVDVRVTHAGSQVLRMQIEQGAGVDVFASADEAHMDALERAGHVAGARVFARNELVVIVPTSNPSRVERFDDLVRAERIVIGTEGVPLGRYTREVFTRAEASLGAAFADGVRARVVSEESNARLVRAKVEIGEADAALVYRTDAGASGRVRSVEIPAELNARARYPIGVLTRSTREELARAFVEYTLSEEGREALSGRGFVVEAP